MAWHAAHPGFWFFPFIPLVWILFFALCFVGVRLILFRKYGRHPGGRCGGYDRSWQGGEEPEEILKRRFANGELTEEEYKKAKDVLKQ
ncbi:SHOCT domain-containing protein [Alicyclobacillus ferrooxydans]|uniref:SHOCT domain-containing protein n=1 Tax=Alicyclobacillus ferrooxydans TaxID=471514 RepID=UPI0006D5A816|nr:SHOCT domain-containing protein [Alicyclobacillus ferrooxydans]